MAEIKSLDGQNFFDLSSQAFGTQDRAIELVLQSQQDTVTDTPIAGTVFTFEKGNNFLLSYYLRNNFTPLTSGITGGVGTREYSDEYNEEYG